MEALRLCRSSASFSLRRFALFAAGPFPAAAPSTKLGRVRCCSGSSGTASRPRLRRASSSSSTSDREAVRSIRLKKVEELRGKGHEPYAYTWAKTHTANELQGLYVDLGNGEEFCSGDDFVSVAGRIVARRAFGKLAFLTLRDNSGTIQVYL